MERKAVHLVEQFERIAAQLAAEYWDDHQQDILRIVDGSFLEEYDEFNIGAQFRNAAACGFFPLIFFDGDFDLPQHRLAPLTDRRTQLRDGAGSHGHRHHRQQRQQALSALCVRCG